MATSPGIPSTRRILFVVDKQSLRRFMIDTESNESALPPTPAQRQRPNPAGILRAVNHSSIKTYGCSSLVITLGLRKQFSFVFVVADVPHPILGADFLHHFNLFPDIQNPLHLTDVQLATGARLKETLANAAILAHPSPDAQLYLMVDASTASTVDASTVLHCNKVMLTILAH